MTYWNYKCPKCGKYIARHFKDDLSFINTKPLFIAKKYHSHCLGKINEDENICIYLVSASNSMIDDVVDVIEENKIVRQAERFRLMS